MSNKYARFAALAVSAALVGAACSDSADETGTSADEPTTEATTAPTTATTAEDAAAEDSAADDAAEEETAAGDEEMADEEMAGDDAGGTITEIAASDPQLSILVDAVTTAGLAETLGGEGPFTVFAPTNEAFEAALAELGITAEELLAREDLADILTYHVVADEVPAADVVGLNGQSVATVNGAEVTISVDGETVLVNDATVTQTDIEAGNGVIHLIDTVLLPPAG